MDPPPKTDVRPLISSLLASAIGTENEEAPMTAVSNPKKEVVTATIGAPANQQSDRRSIRPTTRLGMHGVPGNALGIQTLARQPVVLIPPQVRCVPSAQRNQSPELVSGRNPCMTAAQCCTQSQAGDPFTLNLA